jgi:hypothetical protein
MSRPFEPYCHILAALRATQWQKKPAPGQLVDSGGAAWAAAVGTLAQSAPA